MKILTKEEEAAHYRTTVRGGTLGGLVGLGVGIGTAVLAHKRWPFAAQLTLPFKAFYVTSVGTFAAIVCADRASRGFEASRPSVVGQHEYQHSLTKAIEEAKARRSTKEKLMDWGREWRYSIVSAAWVASMGGSLYWVSKDPFLTKAQKIVQARVYAQGLTLLVLIASAGFEVADARGGKGRWETVEVWDDDSDQVVKRRVLVSGGGGAAAREAGSGEVWRDMIEAEERRMEREKVRRGLAGQKAAGEQANAEAK